MAAREQIRPRSHASQQALGIHQRHVPSHLTFLWEDMFAKWEKLCIPPNAANSTQTRSAKLLFSSMTSTDPSAFGEKAFLRAAASEAPVGEGLDGTDSTAQPGKVKKLALQRRPADSVRMFPSRITTGVVGEKTKSVSGVAIPAYAASPGLKPASAGKARRSRPWR